MLWLMNLRFDFVLLGALAGPAVARASTRSRPSSPSSCGSSPPPSTTCSTRASRGSGPTRRPPRPAGCCRRSAALTLILTPVPGGGHLHRTADPVRQGVPVSGDAGRDHHHRPVHRRRRRRRVRVPAGPRPAGPQLGRHGRRRVITVTLDVILIPRYGALGGAITSAVTYLTTTMVLVVLAHSPVPCSPGGSAALRRRGRGSARTPERAGRWTS